MNLPKVLDHVPFVSKYAVAFQQSPFEKEANATALRHCINVKTYRGSETKQIGDIFIVSCFGFLLIFISLMFIISIKKKTLHNKIRICRH